MGAARLYTTLLTKRGRGVLIKLLGSLLIVISGGVLSVSFCRFQKKRLLVLDSYISLLFFIKGQIDCYLRPISEILSMADTKIIEGCGYKNGIPSSLIEMLPYGRIYLEDESSRLLYNFSEEFGGTYKDEQMKRCDYYIEVLLVERRALCDSIPTKNRVGSALWMCASFGIIIMLW